MNKRDELSLMDLFSLIKKHIWQILISGVVCALVSGLVAAFFVQPKFSSSMKLIIINQNQSVATYSDFQMSAQLVGDCVEIIKSRDLMEEIIDSLSIEDLSPNQLASNIEVDSPTGTRVLLIQVSDSEKIRAKRIADALYDIGADYIRDALAVDYINLIEKPVVPTSPSSPNVERTAILGGLVGFILMVAFIVIKKLLNTKLSSAEEIEAELGITILACIPKAVPQSKRKGHRKAMGYGEANLDTAGGENNG